MPLQGILLKTLHCIVEGNPLSAVVLALMRINGMVQLGQTKNSHTDPRKRARVFTSARVGVRILCFIASSKTNR
jgi:hypothetical protein